MTSATLHWGIPYLPWRWNRMGKAKRPRPARLPDKLLAIRRSRGLSQNDLIRALDFPELDLVQGTISTYELGRREPSLPLLLRYARLAGVPVDVLIDDELDLPKH